MVSFVSGSPLDMQCEKSDATFTNHVDSPTSYQLLSPFGPTPAMHAPLATLQTQIRELEAQRTSERSEYCSIIAKMASTCRSLQRRIDWLERGQQSSAEGTGSRAIKRHTWPLLSTHDHETPSLHPWETSPTQLAHSPLSEIRIFPESQEAGSPNLAAPDNLSVVYNDKAFLSKAFLWF
ncbi:hypothetical protein BC835DRAFT_1332574 [Cytidiella melzeri]|nr:hypothetical protein BC835DRAFT_1332574 [Cytidiella melzeri]